MNASESTLLSLCAETAADLMTPNPISVRDTATLREAVTMLAAKGFSAAPVIDAAGRPVGVFSRSDMLIHDRVRMDRPPLPDDSEPVDLTLESDPGDESLLVRDLMTPVVFSATPETPAARIVDDLVGLHVHQLFVVDRAGVLVGVISALDVVRHLH